MGEPDVIDRPMQLPPHRSPLQLPDPNRSAPPDPDVTEWQDILRGDVAREQFALGGEQRYIGYIIGRLAASQSPALRQYASLPRVLSPAGVDAHADTTQGQVPQPPAANAPNRTANDDPASRRANPLPTPPITPEEAAARDEHIRDSLAALNQTQIPYAQIVARQRMSHGTALLEQSRINTRRQRLIRALGYLMIPTDAMDLRRARTSEDSANRAAARYNEALERYVQAIGGDRAQRDATRLRMMDEFEASVQRYARQAMEPRQPQVRQRQQQGPQGVVPQRTPNVAVQPRLYRPNGVMRAWIESGPRRRAVTMALVAGAGAAALSGALVIVSAPWFVTWLAGAATPFVARSLGARFAVRANRHSFVYPETATATAHEQQAMARNREYIQSIPTDEQQVNVTSAYQAGTRQYSAQALTEKRRAEKASGIGAAIGFFAVQIAANLFKEISEYGPFASKQPLPTASPTHGAAPTPTPNTTPTTTPTPTPGTPGPGSVNYGAWPWDVAQQLGSHDPLQSVQTTITHLNAGGGHYGLIQQASGKEWVEQMVNGRWVPLSPAQQLQFNHDMATLIGSN